VFQRELDHLADLHQLLLESADVFVRDRWRQDLALADGLLFHLDDRVVLDLHDALRRGADHHERQRTAHERDSGDDDDVAFVERTLQQSPLDEILNPLAERDLVALADDWRNRDALRREDLGLADLDLVAEAHADVPAHKPINADDPFPFVFLHHAEELRLDDVDMAVGPDADLVSLDERRRGRLELDFFAFDPVRGQLPADAEKATGGLHADFLRLDRGNLRCALEVDFDFLGLQPSIDAN